MMKDGRRTLQHLVSGCMLAVALSLGMSSSAHAQSFVTYVTGGAPFGEVIFRVTFDPAVTGSAVVTPILMEPIRLDGIDFVGGDLSRVVVGAQGGGDGAITHYNVGTGTKLPAFIASTNAVVPSPPASGTSQPSTVYSTKSHVYYIENQFGFAGGTHRIMRTPLAGPAGTAAVVFDGASPGGLGLKNLEGLEIVGGRQYFFAEEHTAPAFRALYSIGLDGAGLWDGAAPLKHLGGLTAGPGKDGSDELAFDPSSGRLYGTNIISGEVIFFDPVGMTGGFLISPADLAGVLPGSNLARLKGGLTDGIRATGTGYLVLTGLDGIILSIDLTGIASNGLDDGDLRLLYDSKLTGTSFDFDDLTPLAAVPEPGNLMLLAGLSVLGINLLCRRVRSSHQAS